MYFRKCKEYVMRRQGTFFRPSAFVALEKIRADKFCVDVIKKYYVIVFSGLFFAALLFPFFLFFLVLKCTSTLSSK